MAAGVAGGEAEEPASPIPSLRSRDRREGSSPAHPRGESDLRPQGVHPSASRLSCAAPALPPECESRPPGYVSAVRVTAARARSPRRRHRGLSRRQSESHCTQSLMSRDFIPKLHQNIHALSRRTHTTRHRHISRKSSSDKLTAFDTARRLDRCPLHWSAASTRPPHACSTSIASSSLVAPINGSRRFRRLSAAASPLLLMTPPA